MFGCVHHLWLDLCPSLKVPLIHLGLIQPLPTLDLSLLCKRLAPMYPLCWTQWAAQYVLNTVLHNTGSTRGAFCLCMPIMFTGNADVSECYRVLLWTPDSEKGTRPLFDNLSEKHDHTQEYKILVSYQHLIIWTLTFEEVTSVIDVTCGHKQAETKRAWSKWAQAKGHEWLQVKECKQEGMKECAKGCQGVQEWGKCLHLHV